MCVRNILMKGPFKYLNDSFPYPFIYFNSWNPYPFIYLKRQKGTPFSTSFPGLFSAEERMGGKRPGSFPTHPLLGGEKPWERGCPFLAEPPRRGHYREYPFPPGERQYSGLRIHSCGLPLSWEHLNPIYTTEKNGTARMKISKGSVHSGKARVIYTL